MLKKTNSIAAAPLCELSAQTAQSALIGQPSHAWNHISASSLILICNTFPVFV